MHSPKIHKKNNFQAMPMAICEMQLERSNESYLKFYAVKLPDSSHGNAQEDDNIHGNYHDQKDLITSPKNL